MRTRYNFKHRLPMTAIRLRRTLYTISGLVAFLWTVPISAGVLQPDAWANQDVLQVELSPEGTYVALLRAVRKSDDHPFIEVFKTIDLSLVHRQRSKIMKIEAMQWVTDESFAMIVSQQVRRQIEGFNQGARKQRIVWVDIKTKKTQNLDANGLSFAHPLPTKPGVLLVGMLVDGGRNFGYYEVDLEKGHRRLVIEQSISKGGFQFDEVGDVYASVGFDRNSQEQVYYYRPPNTTRWEEARRVSVDDWEQFSILAKDPELDNHLLVAAHNGHDKLGLWSYDVANKQFAEPIVRWNDRDVWTVITHSARNKYPGRIIGVRSFKNEFEEEFLFDETEGAIFNQLKGILDNPGFLQVDQSNESEIFLVSNSHPKEPRTWRLLREGSFKVIASTLPHVAEEDLGERELVKYQADDGTPLVGYLTLPPENLGIERPYPLVVIPHGGPIAPEIAGFDGLAAPFANQGYAVMQPQFRGSMNFGLGLRRAATSNGSEAGRKMQDDKDASVAHLVKQGVADPKRVAMFGWSYGGYAALVASMRESSKGIYQCAIGVAAVSDPVMQVNYYRNAQGFIGVQREEQLNLWLDAYSPFKEYRSVHTPLFLIHGDLDQRVPVQHARKVVAQMAQEEIPHKYLEINGIDHFINTLDYSHWNALWSSTFDYLTNDCGPDGL